MHRQGPNSWSRHRTDARRKLAPSFPRSLIFLCRIASGCQGTHPQCAVPVSGDTGQRTKVGEGHRVCSGPAPTRVRKTEPVPGNDCACFRSWRKGGCGSGGEPGFDARTWTPQRSFPRPFRSRTGQGGQPVRSPNQKALSGPAGTVTPSRTATAARPAGRRPAAGPGSRSPSRAGPEHSGCFCLPGLPPRDPRPAGA